MNAWLSSAATWLRPRRLYVAGGAAGLTSIALVVAVLTAGGASQPSLPDSIVVAVATSTPTPSPTPIPTPEPTPVWPIPAERIPLGEAVGLTNPTSGGFPPAQPGGLAGPANDAGIVRMVSPSLQIDHYVTALGVTDGRMDAPDDDEGTHAVGWYVPGSGGYDFGTPGLANNSVFSAHESWNKQQGPFYSLHRARVGDEIYLDMADGERRHYQVARVTRYLVSEMPMVEVLWPSDRPEWEEWLTLYTCGGDIIYGSTGFGAYLARDVLVAKWVGSTRTPTDTLAHVPDTEPATD